MTGNPEVIHAASGLVPKNAVAFTDFQLGLSTWPNSRLLGNLTAGESTPTSLSAKPVFRAEVGPIRRNQIRQAGRKGSFCELLYNHLEVRTVG
jgi:hypothetical protein